MTDMTTTPKKLQAMITLKEACHSRLFDTNLNAHERALKYNTVICKNLEVIIPHNYVLMNNGVSYTFILNSKCDDGFIITNENTFKNNDGEYSD